MGLDRTYFGLLGPLPLDYLTEIMAHFNLVGPADRLACLGGPPKCLLHLGGLLGWTAVRLTDWFLQRSAGMTQAVRLTTQISKFI